MIVFLYLVLIFNYVLPILLLFFCSVKLNPCVLFFKLDTVFLNVKGSIVIPVG